MRTSKLTKNGYVFLQGEFAKVILGNSTIDEFLATVNNRCSTSRKLYGMSQYDFRVLASWEFTIFEHVMLYRFWYKILEQAARNKLHVDLYRDLLDKSQVHVIHNQDLDSLILKKLHEQE